jgi:1-deoxy-D-xylulose-5-phosphate synthase
MKRRILDGITGGGDLSRLSQKEMASLAEEIREVIISTVARTGGHLAPSLGVVELTLALHTVFPTPRDKIVWDVGHQCYAHKLLTGRLDRFGTLRQYGGISGFPKPSESIHDSFGTGHSGTSISAAIGMVEARDTLGEDFKVVAVIGDGSMTSGEAFEGLNHAGHLGKDLLVVLNDNEMSISPNVGALSSYMNRLMTGQFSTWFRDEFEKILGSLPRVGESAVKFAKRFEEAAKSLVIPGILFEELGFKYVGPIPGHRLQDLIDNFRNVRKLKRPILVHVVTRKGKGYLPAEENPALFHGLGPFDVKTGTPLSKGGPPSYTEVFADALIREARRDDRVVGITAAMLEGTGLSKFGEAFPDRCYDVGIAEQHPVTFAAGLASQGLKPVVAVYSTFLQRGYDQILHDVCLQRLPVVFALDRGGLVGDDGPTHHGLFDLSYLRHIPNLIIMSPKDENELCRMLRTAIEHPGPAAIRYPRGAGEGVAVQEDPQPLPLGSWEVERKGRGVAILATGVCLRPALEAAKMLEESHGREVTVINARFIKPLDEGLLEELASTARVILTVEENALAGGFGSAVLEVLAEHGLEGPRVERAGIPDEFVEHGSQDVLRSKYGLDAAGIYQRLLKMLENGSRTSPGQGRSRSESA